MAYNSWTAVKAKQNLFSGFICLWISLKKVRQPKTSIYKTKIQTLKKACHLPCQTPNGNKK
jgi:hypothetical protein